MLFQMMKSPTAVHFKALHKSAEDYKIDIGSMIQVPTLWEQLNWAENWGGEQYNKYPAVL